MVRLHAMMRASRVVALVVALAATPAAAFTSLNPGAWGPAARAHSSGLCSLATRTGAGRTAAFSLHMKEGPIGRGRGTPDAARQQLAAMEIAEQATRAPMTPEEARRNRRVVSAGQTSPDRPELDIDALLEAKRRRDARRPPTGRGTGGAAAGAGVGMSMKPRSMMDEAERELLRKRQAHARQVLNRNAPEVERGVLYVPGWNDFESAGQMVREGFKEEETVAASQAAAASDGDQERELKSPVEVLELLRHINFHVRDVASAQEEEGEAADEDAAPRPPVQLSESELEIGRVKLMRRHWMEWLEGLEDEELREIKDPAKHPTETRRAFLAEMAEAAANGMEVREASEEAVAEHLAEQEQKRQARGRARNAKEAAFAAKVANRMGNDIIRLGGMPVTAAIEKRVQDLLKGYGQPREGANTPLKTSLVAMAILEEYLGFAEDAEDTRLWKVVAPSLSLDWADGRRADFDTRESAEFELADARAARGMLQTDFVRGRPGEEADVVRAGPPAEGDAVSIKVMAQTPLGYALLVNSQYDGLVYHSEVFDDPPRVGAVAQAWVSKVRRDGKLDITLRRPGAHMRILDGARRVYFALQDGGGSMPVGDRTDPDIIRDFLGLSKKNFKDALGHLYRRTMVRIEPESVALRPREEWRDDAEEIVAAAADARRWDGGGGGGGGRREYERAPRGGARSRGGPGRYRGGRDEGYYSSGAPSRGERTSPRRSEGGAAGGAAEWGTFVPTVDAEDWGDAGGRGDFY